GGEGGRGALGAGRVEARAIAQVAQIGAAFPSVAHCHRQPPRVYPDVSQYPGDHPPPRGRPTRPSPLSEGITGRNAFGDFAGKGRIADALRDPVVLRGFAFQVRLRPMSGANDYQRQVVQAVNMKTAAPEPEEERLGWLRPVVLAHSPATDFAQRFGPDQPAGSDGYAGVEVSGRPAIAFAQSLEEHLQRVKGEPASPERDAGGRAQA